MARQSGIITTPLRIVLAYAAFGAAWILFSDRIVEWVITDIASQQVAQTIKGGLYVVVTAALLYGLMRRHLHERQALDAAVRITLDAVTDAILVVNAEGRVVDANQAAVALVGASSRRDLLLPMEDVIGRMQLAHADGRPITFAESASRRALQGETVTGSEARMRGGDGHELLVTVSSAPLRGGHEAGPLALTVLHDMTDVKRFEEIREDFLATAAHEFKTPLAVVKAHAQLMARRGQGDPAALEVIGRQIDRLTRMVQQLLEVSRFGVGGAELRRERFDLEALLEEIAASVRARSEGRRIVVERVGGANVVADRDRVGRVVESLLENAVRFSPRGGDVEVSLASRDHEARVSVRDHGVGIAPERQARVFERYYRAHSGTSHDYGGLGIGLGMCREIVVRHGGRIGFDSEPGVGSTFWFTLPLSPEARS